MLILPIIGLAILLLVLLAWPRKRRTGVVDPIDPAPGTRNAADSQPAGPGDFKPGGGDFGGGGSSGSWGDGQSGDGD